MISTVESMWRHPVKGFTPEPVREAALAAGGNFPCDRLFAVEDGPSGFDPEAPGHISKQKFTVLAKIPAVARVHTSFDEASGTLSASFDGHPPLKAVLTSPEGREAFASWLTEALRQDIQGPLKVLQGPGAHRFTDHPRGFVSIINLASVRELQARIGRQLDPRRFRANLYVEGWPAWIENAVEGRNIRLGEARGRVLKPIVRCVATHVDPQTGERDMDVVNALNDGFGHTLCGIYVEVEQDGRVRVGDEVALET
jgi:uncharacterized protein YcbX